MKLKTKIYFENLDSFGFFYQPFSTIVFKLNTSL